MQPDPARLNSLPLFESLTLEQCQDLAALTEEREVDAGQRLTPEGSAGYTFFVIEEGTADVFHDDAFIRTMGPGDHFGELAILGDGRRTATVVSTSPMKLVAIFGTVYRQIEAEMPDVAKRIEEVVRARS
jgi:CRP-like cAMP-binding protein